MPSCSVCGDDERFLNTCNNCGKKHCPEHQLPENHVCIPRKSDMADADDSSERWFSEKHERSNVMADERRGERELTEDPDPHLEETETKRPLDEDEIDADTSSSPHDWVHDVQQNREALNDRLSERRSTSSGSESDSTTSYPHDAASERRKNRERMNQRLSGDKSASPEPDPSASTPPSPMTGATNAESSTDTPSRIPSALWIVVLLALVIVAYIAIGTL